MSLHRSKNDNCYAKVTEKRKDKEAIESVDFDRPEGVYCNFWKGNTNNRRSRQTERQNKKSRFIFTFTQKPPYTCKYLFRHEKFIVLSIIIMGLCIGTWNVRGVMSSTLSLREMLDQTKCDVALISEHKDVASQVEAIKRHAKNVNF